MKVLFKSQDNTVLYTYETNDPDWVINALQESRLIWIDSTAYTYAALYTGFYTNTAQPLLHVYLTRYEPTK